MVKPGNILKGASSVFSRIKKHAFWVIYRWIQSIRVICCSLLLLASDTHGLQLATENVYKVEVHVFIYSHT
jgi:hypothetical protein